MAKRETLKLPDDFLGTVSALLNTPPPKQAKKKAAKKGAKTGKGAKKR